MPRLMRRHNPPFVRMRPGRSSPVPSQAARLLAAVLVVAVGCAETATDPDVPVPTTIALSTPAVAIGAIGSIVQLTATVKDQNQTVIAGALITWATSAPQVASVDSGRVTGESNGTATISATSGSLRADAVVSVQQIPAMITVSPDSLVLIGEGDTALVTAAVADSGGTLIEDPDVAYTTDPDSVATVTPEGLVTAMAAGSATVRAVASGNGAAVERAVPVTVYALLEITTTDLPSGVLGVDYGTVLLDAEGGNGSYAWSLAAASEPLPAGMSLSAAGELNGRPTAVEARDVAFQVVSGDGQVAVRHMPIGVTGLLVLVTTELPNAGLDAPYAHSLVAAGGTGGYVWSLLSGSLPAGLALDSASGQIAGTATTPGSAEVTVGVTSGDGQAAQRALSLSVNEALAVTTTSLPDGTQYQPYTTEPLVAEGGGGSYAWGLAAGSDPLPPGLTLDSTGTITG
ncbi:MAG TPA: putative Ig domain-containing protein, partial [Gemmatimonadales bacterium]